MTETAFEPEDPSSIRGEYWSEGIQAAGFKFSTYGFLGVIFETK